MSVKTNYTREELIAICEKSFVPQKDWKDRDSFETQKQVGEIYAMLKAGCKFEIQVSTREKDKGCVTDEETIWLKFWAHTFMWFETGDDSDEEGYEVGEYYYLPTLERLNEKAGKDWY